MRVGKIVEEGILADSIEYRQIRRPSNPELHFLESFFPDLQERQAFHEALNQEMTIYQYKTPSAAYELSIDIGSLLDDDPSLLTIIDGFSVEGQLDYLSDSLFRLVPRRNENTNFFSGYKIGFRVGSHVATTYNFENLDQPLEKTIHTIQNTYPSSREVFEDFARRSKPNNHLQKFQELLDIVGQ